MLDNNNINISKMTLSDLEEIKENLINDFDDFWKYEIFKEELVNTNSNYLVLRYNNEIISFAGFKTILDEADLMNIVTKKTFRNKGFAKIILNELINLAKENNLKTITLEVNESNKPAILLYKNLSFKKVGLRKNYYNNTDNAILMTLTLN